MLSIKMLGRDFEWHVGESPPILYGDVKDVTEVQADGHELDYIINNMEGLPIAKTRVVRWFGDHARFIVANLRYKR